MMDYTEKVKAYNTEIRDALRTLYEALPAGQQRTVLKNTEVEKLLKKYKVVKEN